MNLLFEDIRAAFVGITRDEALQGSKPIALVDITAAEAFRGTLTDDRMKYDPSLVMAPKSGFKAKIRLFAESIMVAT